jgi:hypothetical protein
MLIHIPYMEHLGYETMALIGIETRFTLRYSSVAAGNPPTKFKKSTRIIVEDFLLSCLISRG